MSRLRSRLREGATSVRVMGCNVVGVSSESQQLLAASGPSTRRGAGGRKRAAPAVQCTPRPTERRIDSLDATEPEVHLPACRLPLGRRHLAPIACHQVRTSTLPAKSSSHQVLKSSSHQVRTSTLPAKSSSHQVIKSSSHQVRTSTLPAKVIERTPLYGWYSSRSRRSDATFRPDEANVATCGGVRTVW